MPLFKIFKSIVKYIPNSLKNIIKYFLNDIANFIDYIALPFNLIKEKQNRKTWIPEYQIKSYRKTIKIYDVFNFYNELETLDIRLNILNEYVDFFVLVESSLTHSGTPKDLFYKKNKDLFEKFNHKIIHVIIDNPIKSFEDAKERLKDPKTSEIEKNILKEALSSDNVPNGAVPSLRIFYEKEYAKKALVGLSENDFCYISDLDEIWNPEIIIDYSKDYIYKYKQNNYAYFLNNRSNENWIGWTGTIGTKYKNIKNGCLNHLRTIGKNDFIIIRNGGWHFTWQGGIERIKTKLESYDHQEFNTKEKKDDLNKTILENKDIRGKHIKYWVDNKNLPKYLLDNKEKYKNLFI